MAVKKKTVLVTGAAGSLAKRVISRLHLKWNVVVVDFRRKVETDAGIPSYCVETHKRGFEDIFRNHKIDAVVHIGRMFAHESNRMRRYNANVLGTRKLLELCKKYGVGQVLIHSTYYVYGADPYNPALIDEEVPLKASEITQDLVDSVELENLANIYLWKHPELNITILRPCNILGPGVRNTMSVLLSPRVAPGLAPGEDCREGNGRGSARCRFWACRPRMRHATGASRVSRDAGRSRQGTGRACAARSRAHRVGRMVAGDGLSAG